MRISDWSSDVCSSDLRGYFHGRKTAARTTIWQDGLPPLTARRRVSAPVSVRPVRAGRPCAGRNPRPGRGRSGRCQRDRKDVTSGQRVDVRVDIGGRLTIKKKNIKTTEIDL